MLLRKDTFFFFIIFLWTISGFVAIFAFHFKEVWIISLFFQMVLLFYILLASVSKRWRNYIYSESTLFKKKIK